MQILPISFKNNLIGLCVAVLGLHCCTGAALVEGHGLLTAVASLAVDRGL